MTSTKKTLPEWFNIEKYGSLSPDNGEIIYFQLCARSSILKELTNSKKLDYIKHSVWNAIQNHGVINQQLSDEYEQILVTKLYSEGKFTEQDGIKRKLRTVERHRKENNLHKPIELQAIKQITLGEMCNMGAEAIEKLSSLNHLHDKFPIPMDVTAKYRPFDIECGGSNKLSLTIDLNCTNKEIVKSLEDNLAKFRFALNFSRANSDTFSNIDIPKLINNKIIPLLDLEIWSKLNEIHLTKQQKLETVSPDGYIRDIDQLRKTVEPLMDRCITPNFLSQMASHLNIH